MSGTKAIEAGRAALIAGWLANAVLAGRVRVRQRVQVDVGDGALAFALTDEVAVAA
jgi:hypothetical protein